MAYDNATRTFTVGTDDELNAAIANLDAIGKTGNNNALTAGDYTIQFAQSITLDGTVGGFYAAQNADGTAGPALTINPAPNLYNVPGPYTVAASSQLYALNLSDGVRVTIEGNGNTLDGNGANTTGAQAYNGFFVYNGQVAIQNLTIANTVARGGDSGNGGGGAGLGGGLFVTGTFNSGANPTPADQLVTGGNVTLTNVSFTGNAARGGNSGVGTGDGGGGLQGGSAGDSSGGGVGFGASGSTAGSGGGIGLIPGGAPGGGAAQSGSTNGGIYGGGGGNYAGGGVSGSVLSTGRYFGNGGFGGGGLGARSGSSGGGGGFGGGGGASGISPGGGGFGGGGGIGVGRVAGGGFGAGTGSSVYSPPGGRSGGGGLGAGADVFVQRGGILTIQGTATLGAGTVTGGTGRNSENAGAGLGSGLFLQGDQSVTLAPGAGQTLTVSGVIADQSGSQSQLTSTQGFSEGSGSLIIGAGTVVLAPVTTSGGTTSTTNTYTGGTTIRGGGILQLGGAGAAGTGAISFASLSSGATATLSLTQNAQPTNATFSNTIANFGPGSRLDLQGLTNGTVSYNSANTSITVTGLRSGASLSQTYALSDPSSTSFVAQDNGQGGTVVIVCFVTGTLIRTSRGEVAVEELRVGDIAVTTTGALRPISWIGHRSLDGQGCTLPYDQQPIRIRAGAFGPGLPTRDLRLSPGHPVLVGADTDGAGGHLVPVMCLINGTSIAREPVAAVTYWHVELDGHDILLAEGLPAESYLDWGDRPFFEEASDHALHNPDLVVPGLSARCRPVAVEGPVVEAERGRLSSVFAASLGEACAWDQSGHFDWIAA